MRSVFSSLAVSLLLTSAAIATDERPGQAMTGSKGWNVLVEFTPEKVLGIERRSSRGSSTERALQ